MVGLQSSAEQLLVERIEQAGVRDKQHVTRREFGEGISECGPSSLACVRPLFCIYREIRCKTLMRLKAKTLFELSHDLALESSKASLLELTLDVNWPINPFRNDGSRLEGSDKWTADDDINALVGEHVSCGMCLI